MTDGPLRDTGPDRSKVLETLRTRGALRLRERHFSGAYLFGSVARGTAGPASDVDIFAEVRAGAGISLLDLADIQEKLSQDVGFPVQLTVPGARKRDAFFRLISDDAIKIF